MADAEKEKHGAALIGELLLQLAQRDGIRSKLAEMGDVPAAGLIKELLDEFEKIVGRRQLKALLHDRLNVSLPVEPSPRPKVAPSPPAPPKAEKQADAAPRVTEKPALPKPASPNPPPALPKVVPPRVEQPKEVPPRVERPKDVPPHVDRPPVQEPEPEEEEELGTVAERIHQRRVPYDLAEDDIIYLHAVANTPEGDAQAFPFMLEDRGIEGRDVAFAFDYRGLRLYLSTIRRLTANVTRAGVLLLGKQESMHLRGVHEGILNDLRLHGTLLPFEFGSVVRGKDELMTLVDLHLFPLKDTVDDLLSTTWWNLSLYVLDSQMARHFVQEPQTSVRSPDRYRPNFASAAPSKIDIKTLERLLARQKRIAESVHDELRALAERSDVDMMINLAGGSSEDWKLILKSSYEVPRTRIEVFNRALTDLQYKHVQYDLIFSLTGNRESFTFQDR
jgi:hypothetical protein